MYTIGDLYTVTLPHEQAVRLRPFIRLCVDALVAEASTRHAARLARTYLDDWDDDYPDHLHTAAEMCHTAVKEAHARLYRAIDPHAWRDPDTGHWYLTFGPHNQIARAERFIAQLYHREMHKRYPHAWEPAIDWKD